MTDRTSPSQGARESQSDERARPPGGSSPHLELPEGRRSFPWRDDQSPSEPETVVRLPQSSSHTQPAANTSSSGDRQSGSAAFLEAAAKEGSASHRSSSTRPAPAPDETVIGHVSSDSAVFDGVNASRQSRGSSLFNKPNLAREGSSFRVISDENDLSGTKTIDADAFLVQRLFPSTGSSMKAEELDKFDGLSIAHFRLISRLGVGGMGAVFLAEDEVLRRQVALKVLAPSQSRDESSVARFRNEARAAATLDDEHVARVYSSGEDRGLYYIAYEYVEGRNLRDLIRQYGRLDPAEAVHYTLQVARALIHLAELNVIHRDIKPSNILITKTGHAKLVDLGLARCQLSEESVELTVAGTTLGTFDYISPEQAKDPRTVDIRSDIYSLGCTIYHMLTGEPPYPEGTVLQKLLDHQGRESPDPAVKNPRVTPPLSMIVRKMMASDQRKRYGSPQELVRDLTILARQMGLSIGGAVVALPPRSRWREGLQQNIGWIATACLLLLVVLVLDRFPRIYSLGGNSGAAVESKSLNSENTNQSTPGNPFREALRNSAAIPPGTSVSPTTPVLGGQGTIATSQSPKADSLLMPSALSGMGTMGLTPPVANQTRTADQTRSTEPNGSGLNISGLPGSNPGKTIPAPIDPSGLVTTPGITTPGSLLANQGNLPPETSLTKPLPREGLGTLPDPRTSQPDRAFVDQNSVPQTAAREFANSPNESGQPSTTTPMARPGETSGIARNGTPSGTNATPTENRTFPSSASSALSQATRSIAPIIIPFEESLVSGNWLDNIFATDADRKKSEKANPLSKDLDPSAGAPAMGASIAPLDPNFPRGLGEATPGREAIASRTEDPIRGSRRMGNSTDVLIPFDPDRILPAPTALISIVGGKSFESLEAACVSAKSGDVIELRYQGRQLPPERPLRIVGKSITIRGARGYRPVVQFAPKDSLQPVMMAVNHGGLSLIHLDLEWDLPQDVTSDLWSLVSNERAEKLSFQNVRVTVRNPRSVPATILRQSSPIGQPGAIISGMKNSMSKTTSETTLNSSLFRGGARFCTLDDTAPARYLIEDSLIAMNDDVIRTQGLMDVMAEVDQLEMTFSHSTILSRQHFLRLGGSDDFTTVMAPLSCQMRNCIISVGARKPLILQQGMAGESELKRLLAWSGDRNFYDAIDPFWQNGMASYKLKFDRWKQFWNVGGELTSSQNLPIEWRGRWMSRAFETLIPEDVELDATSDANPLIHGATDGTNVGVPIEKLPVDPT